ncbi:multicopper oxidase family protein [Tunturiibacter gelidoferens]|jgi:FtsP/CotA-like multicopper oxidase with cupredoxin domain|uniref:FtsP/CotA-like multicopper oxidase with cupredoxin domain n=1 Tax=Tunturiibacter gelidiferens TaxID=3069689 RepID=A0A9X0QH74_9BACT|nr:multicopper oxidase domain-containing protein [Edaphobacter lichenicola]MBB5330214.1 FtsP/CotA-like multicopper oxidase with cupredoxin domain [Edaphobacter lichenicola]
MKRKSLFVSVALLCLAAIVSVPGAYAAGSETSNRTICPRYPAGSSLVEPKDLFSSHGILQVSFTYETRVDQYGNVLYCFMSEDGSQSPTLHVRPGDELLVKLKNALPPSTTPSYQKHAMAGMSTLPEFSISGQSHEASPNCGGMVMTDTSTNLHYHGTNTPPICHQDEVIKTLINAGETFQYDVHFPLDEPPGLYWYHPHVHGISEAAVQGGASGAIIVEGIENINHDVAALPERTLIVRDNLVPGAPNADDVPAWDLSLNYIPVVYPEYQPAVIPAKPMQKQFWRVVNAAADTILDLQVQYDGVAQDLEIVAIDGVPTGSQDGRSGGRTLSRKHFLLAPAARVEFILRAPPKSVKNATLLTLNVDTGPDGDNDPQRPLAAIKVSDAAKNPSLAVGAVSAPPPLHMRFQGLSEAKPVKQRKLYFSEVLTDPTDPNSPTNFFITVDGATPTLFDPDNPPAIITTQGSVEDWTIENRALENHEFHIHQIHFLVLERDGKPVEGEYRDMINVPFWSGSGSYPSVKLRMDFRGPDIGDFVYHCHILGHEDSGMMAIIRVLPQGRPTQ